MAFYTSVTHHQSLLLLLLMSSLYWISGNYAINTFIMYALVGMYWKCVCDEDWDKSSSFLARHIVSTTCTFVVSIGIQLDQLSWWSVKLFYSPIPSILFDKTSQLLLKRSEPHSFLNACSSFRFLDMNMSTEKLFATFHEI